MQLKWVKKVRSKGKTYYYFDTGKLVDGKKVHTRLPDIKADDFAMGYAILKGHRNRKAPTEALRVPGLIDLFQKAEDYRELTGSSKKVYDIYLRRFAKLMPTAPAAEITKEDMIRLFDGMADTPGAANLFLGVCGALFKWGKSRGYVATNPCDEIKKFKLGEHQPWPEHVLEAALVAKDARVRLLTRLLYFTAQRINDVLRMTWSDIQGNAVRVVQQKTKKKLTIPMHTMLLEEMTRTPKAGLTIFAQPNGKPYSEEKARDLLKSFCADMGVSAVPHGLRKNAVISLLEVGCSMAETAAVSGQSLQVVEHYAKERNQERLAGSAVVLWERNRK